MKLGFSHLHTHSHYSLLNALPKIPELVENASKAGMKSLALTDNGNLYGAIEFFKECKKKEIKPILGIDAYLAARSRKDKEARIDNRRTRLVLLIKDSQGYKNILKLVTDSHLVGFYYKPRIDLESMKNFSEGLILLIPNLASELSLALKNDNQERALQLIDDYKKIYGQDDVYLEITRHPELDGHEDLVKKTLDFAKNTRTKICASQEVYYLKPEDREARETLLSIQPGMGESIYDREFIDFSFHDSETMQKKFEDLPEALEKNQEIVEKCNLEIELGKWKFPQYQIESKNTPDEELKFLAYRGAREKNLPIELGGEHEKRLDYELEVIKMKGYAPYFLVVADLIREASERKILTNIRGSVAGSLTTYVLNITKVNPVEYKLPFERFLNPERPSAPDIDMDFADNRRDEIIAYVREKYGEDKVAQVGTFGTMMARGSVRDVTRALGFPIALGDKIAKLIPMGMQGFPMTIDRALTEVAELKELYDKEPDTKKVIEMAKKIEGCARHIGVHAAGVVISPEPLIEHVPLQFDPKGEEKIITQYDMYSACEDGVGLLKFDFLGIRNLAILADAVRIVRKLKGIEIDIDNISTENKKTFEMLARGETVGLFQLNGSGMTKFLKELRPTTIHDINAMVALYRPGPIESIPKYIERKHNPQIINYLDDRMKEILEKSYGVITYQDDVMMISIKLGGYSWLEADVLRKAMGKKIPKLMEEQKNKLIEGFVKNGLTQSKATELWKLIEPFAAYGFNKAHAASYGKVAYQTAYMKANYPAIYMAAVLTAESGDIEKIAEIISECKRMGINILPPDINESFEGFTVVKNKDTEREEIRFGLTTIKNFGEGVAHVIIEERKINKFKSIQNFLERVHHRALNRKSLEALIKVGAFDSFADRKNLLEQMDELLTYNKSAEKTLGHNSLFGSEENERTDSLHFENESKATSDEKLSWEKELLGIYVSGHPLDKFRQIIEKSSNSISKIYEQQREGVIVSFISVILDIRSTRTKKGEEMAFVRVEDFSGNIETVLFPRTWKDLKDKVSVGSCVMVKAKVSKRNGELSLLAEEFRLPKNQ